MSQNFSSVLNTYIPEIIRVLAVFILYAVIDLWVWSKKNILPKIEAYYDAHTTIAQRAAFAANEVGLKALGKAAFIYAQTVFNSLGGAQKLEKAISYFSQDMSRYGLTNLTPEAIREAIEEAWKEDNSKANPQTQSDPKPQVEAPVAPSAKDQSTPSAG